MPIKRAKLAVAAAITAGGLTLATGLAVANGGFPGLDSHAGDDAAEHTADLNTLPTQVNEHDTSASADNNEFEADDHETSDSVKSTDVENEQGTSETARPEDNHGWFVSQAATSTETTGSAKGAYVSGVAKGDDGKPDNATADHPSADAGSQRSTTATASQDKGGDQHQSTDETSDGSND